MQTRINDFLKQTPVKMLETLPKFLGSLTQEEKMDNLDEIDVIRLVLVGMNGGKGFNTEPEDPNYFVEMMKDANCMLHEFQKKNFI